MIDVVLLEYLFGHIFVIKSCKVGKKSGEVLVP